MNFGRMKHVSRRNHRRRCLLVERLEGRRLLSASRVALNVEVDSSATELRSVAQDTFEHRDGVLRGAQDNRSDGFNSGNRSIQSHQQSSVGKYENLSTAQAWKRNVDVPTQITNSGRGMPLDVANVHSLENDSLRQESVQRFVQEFQRPERLPAAEGHGLRKAVAERQVNANLGSPDDRLGLSVDSAASPNTFAPSIVAATSLESTSWESTGLDSSRLASRVVAPPPSYSVLALSLANEVELPIAPANPTVSVAPPTNPPSVAVEVSPSNQIESMTSDGGTLGGTVNLGPTEAVVTSLRTSRSQPGQRSVNNVALDVLAQIEALRNEVVFSAVETSTANDLPRADASETGSSMRTDLSLPSNVMTRSTGVSDSPTGVSESREVRTGATDARQSVSAGITRQSELGVSTSRAGRADEQSIDALLAESDTAMILALTDAQASHRQGGLDLNAVSEFEVRFDQQLDAFLSADSRERGVGPIGQCSGQEAFARQPNSTQSHGLGGFIELPRNLRNSIKTSEFEFVIENAAGAQQPPNRAAQAETSEAAIDSEWMAEREDVDYGGFVELADGTEQCEQWLAMNLASDGSEILSAYDPASIEATAAVYRSIDLVGSISVSRLNSSHSAESHELEVLSLFGEPISLGESFGLPFRKSLVVVPVAMIVSAYLVRQQVFRDDQLVFQYYRHWRKAAPTIDP